MRDAPAATAAPLAGLAIPASTLPPPRPRHPAPPQPPAPAPAGGGAPATSARAPSPPPPLLTVNRSSRGQAPGFIFAAIFQNKFFTEPLVGQGGPMILDNQGRYVWLKAAAKS